MATICASITEEESRLLQAFAEFQGWQRQEILRQLSLTDALAEARALLAEGALTLEHERGEP